MRTVAFMRLWSDSGYSKGGVGHYAADQSAVRLLRQDVVKTSLALAAVGALERVGYATFRGAKERIQKSEFSVFCKAQQLFAIFVEDISTIGTQRLAVYSSPPSPLFPVLAFASVRTKTSTKNK